MIRELTVRQNILHSARIRLPKDWTQQQISDHVDNVLRELHLDQVADTRIGDELSRGISGGQRKRVNIAIELVVAPVCMFLDEPTSGLDSTASFEVMEILSRLKKLSMTIVAVVHQPRIEIFDIFDDLLLLVPGGQTAYFGKRDQAIRYFENLGYIFRLGSNPADVMMDILAGKGVHQNEALTPKELVEKWDNHKADMNLLHLDSNEIIDSSMSINKTRSNKFETTAKRVISKRGAPFWKQVLYCHNRSIMQQFASLSSFQIEMFVAIVTVLLLL